MTKIAYHHDKKSGVTYAYSAKSYRDPVTGKPRSKQVYLGKLNKETGEIEKTDRGAQTKKKSNKPLANIVHDENLQQSSSNELPYAIPLTTTKVTGPYLLLDKIAYNLGLLSILKKVFPKNYLEILSVVYYIVHKGQPLYRVETWSKTNLQPYNFEICGQRVSELLRIITEDEQQMFLSLWLKK